MYILVLEHVHTLQAWHHKIDNYKAKLNNEKAVILNTAASLWLCQSVSLKAAFSDLLVLLIYKECQ